MYSYKNLFMIILDNCLHLKICPYENNQAGASVVLHLVLWWLGIHQMQILRTFQMHWLEEFLFLSFMKKKDKLNVLNHY